MTFCLLQCILWRTVSGGCKVSFSKCFVIIVFFNVSVLYYKATDHNQVQELHQQFLVCFRFGIKVLRGKCVIFLQLFISLNHVPSLLWFVLKHFHAFCLFVFHFFTTSFLCSYLYLHAMFFFYMMIVSKAISKEKEKLYCALNFLLSAAFRKQIY